MEVLLVLLLLLDQHLMLKFIFLVLSLFLEELLCLKCLMVLLNVVKLVKFLLGLPMLLPIVTPLDKVPSPSPRPAASVSSSRNQSGVLPAPHVRLHAPQLLKPKPSSQADRICGSFLKLVTMPVSVGHPFLHPKLGTKPPS